MEIDITRFFNAATPSDYSASVMEKGENAGPQTWQAACRDSEEFYILNNKDKREAFRVFVRGFGAWTDEEINAWSNAELNALCIQFISGDMREAGLDHNASAEDWERHDKSENAGRLFKGIDGKIYFYIGE